MREISKDNLLRSWKEIAVYLGVDVRTCHRWEDQRGMPVHRAESLEKKSPVFAYKDELDAWFKETFRGPEGNGKRTEKRRPWLKWALAGAAALALAAAFLAWSGLLLKGPPEDFGIEGSFFVAKDRFGRALWRRDTGLDNLEPEAFYRNRFQVKGKEGGGTLPLLVMKDIDGDGRTEVLFAPKRRTDQTGEGLLVCWDRRGNQRWAFPAGRELVCKGTVYSPDYRVQGISVHDLDGDGRLETIVESYQAPDWPCQLAVLDAAGKPIGEFWNAGYLRDLVFHDLDGDGREELIVVGVNNEHKGGCLVVFDPLRVSGGSPQTGEYACDGIGPGSMLFYVTVPYTDVSRAMRDQAAGLEYVEINSNRRIKATMGSGLIYEFGFDLAALQVQAGHAYKNLHAEMVEAGRISSVLDDAYRAGLLAGVRWWAGSAWASTPTAVLR